ncbi:MAG: trypsin-like peptidase domain-containing protein [candidate division WOR-3 bacterium]|nr:MAG: trypsin-like peptidase domain-containing protein [candidate division WOR-3 bacterium]
MLPRVWLVSLAAGSLSAQVLVPDLVRAASRVRPAVVSITTDKLRTRRAGSGDRPMVQVRSAGSGFVVRPEGYVLTCNHVVAGYEEILVEFEDRTEFGGGEVRVVGRDPVTDLAVLKVEADRSLPAVEYGDSDRLEPGQWVVALGSPYGLEGTVTAGVVSATGRWGLAKSSGPDFQDFIQTDVLINPGNSGGPLVDGQGRVVGVSSFTKSTVSDEFTGIGFAIPINLARKVADELIKRGKVIRGYAGINTQPLTEGIRRAIGLESEGGVMVAGVAPDRPGARAGIKPGDVVLSIDGRTAVGVRELQEDVAARSPGSEVVLAVWRRGTTTEVELMLEAWPVAETGPRTAPEEENWLGLVVRDLSRADMVKTGVADGVVITAIEPASPADEVNLRAGDVIVEINYAQVKGNEAFEKIAAAMEDNDRPALMRVYRGVTAYYVAVGP